MLKYKIKKTACNLWISFLVLPTLMTGIALAENDTRDYISPPGPCSALVLYQDHISGNEVYRDGDKIGQNFNFKGNVTAVRYSRFLEKGPVLFDPTIIVPFGDLSIDGSDVGGDFSTSGIGDPILAAGFWLVHDQASKTWFALSQYITLPLGDYDKDEVLNMGTNRWSFTEEFGIVKGFDNGFYVDFVANAKFFTDNNDYGSTSVTLEQEPIYTLEGHVSYDVSKSTFVSADYYHHTGGETTVDGIEQEDEQNDHFVQLSCGIQLNRNYQVLLKYRRPLKVENGPKTNDFGIRLVYAF